MKHFILFLFVLFLLPTTINAQEEKEPVIVTIVTKSNLYFSGKLININTDSVFIFNEEYGDLAFGRNKVKHIRNGIIKPKFKNTTNSSVPYYTQTAISNGRGNHYYKNYYIFGNEFNFGLTEYLNMSVGFESATLIFDNGNQFPIVQLGAKYSVPLSDAFHAGLASTYYLNGSGGALLLGAPITLGDDRTNFTILPNFIFADDERRLSIFANLSLAFTDNTRLVIDYARVDGEGIAPIVLEIMFKSGFTLSPGVLVTSGGTGPNLAFSIPFGRWKEGARF